MRIIVKHNIDKKLYHAYIPMVGFSADIPEEAYSNYRVLELMIEYTKDKIKLDIRDDLDSSKAIELRVQHILPSNGLEYLSLIRYINDYDLREYPYLTVEYTGKIFVHKDYPYKDFGDESWISESHEAIGYLPESILIENADELEDESNYLYDTVYKCVVGEYI